MWLVNNMIEGLGVFFTLSIFILMIIDICLTVSIDIGSIYRITKGKNKDVSQESMEYSSRSLIFVGLIFAGITLLISSYKDDLKNVEDTLIILIFALSLFLLSYKIEVLTATREIYWIIQDRVLNYGFLAIVISLLTFFYKVFYSSFAIGILVFTFIIIFVIHLCELRSDLAYRKNL